MCVINVSSQRYEVNAMYFKFGRVVVILLNVSLIAVICMVLSEFYGVVIFRNGGYTEWSSFSICTARCGGGVRHRKRECSNPEPSLGGRNCSIFGPSVEIVACNIVPCPVNGGFERWSNYDECSVSCGGGTQSRSRFCIQPVPKYGGLDCGIQNMGPYEETRSCNENPCVTHGGYTTWSDWGTCSASCGKGLISRTRTCTNPVPSEDGNDCSQLGPAKEENGCTVECPIDGKYGEWSSWNLCSKSCDGGLHTRVRKCDSPSPENGGKSCIEKKEGNPTDTKPCNKFSCDADGGFTEWGEWSPCSKTCGDGRIERRRTCTNPKPIGKGKSCRAQKLGARIEADECNLMECDVNK